MSRIRHLTLSQFRSHPRALASFDGRPVVLFGANGAGKTNLLEAVSLLSPGRGLRRAQADDLIGKPAGLGWKISAVLDRAGILHEVETQASPGAPRSVRIDGKAAPQSALSNLGAMLWLTPAMDRLWIEAAEGRRRFLDRLAMGFHPDHAETVLSYEKAMRERNRLLRDEVADPAWYGALEAHMGIAGAQMTANRVATLKRLAAAADPGSPFPQADLSLIDEAPASEFELAEVLAQGRYGRRAHPDRSAPCRSGGDLDRAGQARRAMFDRRTKGDADRADSGPCARPDAGYRAPAGGAVGRDRGASG